MIISDPSAAIADELDDLIEWAAAQGVTLGIELDDDGVLIHLGTLDRDTADASTKGAGRRVMDRLCGIADRHGLMIETDHMADEPGLGTYYGSFGFVGYDMPGGYDHLRSMRRHPGARP